MAEPRERRLTPSGPRLAGGVMGLVALVAMLVLWFGVPILPAYGYVFTALTYVVLALPLAGFLALLAFAPDKLDPILRRRTRLDLADGGHVAAAVVMAIALYFVIGNGLASGVAAIEAGEFAPPLAKEPPPSQAAEGAPPAPALNATVEGSSVNLTWNATAENATYRVYRGADNASVSFIAETNATGYVDDTTSIGSAYAYALTAQNGSAESAPSEAIVVVIPYPEELLMSGSLAGLFWLVLAPALYVGIVHGLGPRATFGALGLHGRRFGLAIGVGVASALVLVYGLGLALSPFLSEEPTSDKVLAIGAGISLTGVLVISTIAGLGEEIFFRGFLQARVGIIAQAVIFGLVHLNYATVLQVVVPLLLGLVFGLLYKWTGNLWAPVVAHFGFDLLNLIAAMCGADPAQCGL